MLVVLMYHRIIEPEDLPGSLLAFTRHLADLASHYNIVVPGERLVTGRINLCLTFDDAYYDFYKYIFPLLVSLNLRAVLAIPAGLILENTTIDDERRLAVPYLDAMSKNQQDATLCTWEEINTMVASTHVIPACHGLTHVHLANTEQALEQEVVYAKQLLAAKTAQSIDTYVYPYGQMTRAINRYVKEHYRYTMRIGSALNLSWANCHGVIYRINADVLWRENKRLPHMAAMGARFVSNSLRFK